MIRNDLAQGGEIPTLIASSARTDPYPAKREPEPPVSTIVCASGDETRAVPDDRPHQRRLAYAVASEHPGDLACFASTETPPRALRGAVGKRQVLDVQQGRTFSAHKISNKFP
jgi:hypothetical protein